MFFQPDVPWSLPVWLAVATMFYDRVLNHRNNGWFQPSNVAIAREANVVTHSRSVLWLAPDHWVPGTIVPNLVLVVLVVPNWYWRHKKGLMTLFEPTPSGKQGWQLTVLTENNAVTFLWTFLHVPLLLYAWSWSHGNRGRKCTSATKLYT